VDHRDWGFGPNEELRAKYDNRLSNLQAAGVLHLKKSSELSTGKAQDD